MEAALIRPVLRRLFWLIAADRGLLPDPLDPPVRTYTPRRGPRPWPPLHLSPEEITRLNPNTGTCPVFRTGRDARITLDVYRRVPVLVREGQPGGDPWGITFTRMLDMTVDARRFRRREELERDGWRLDGNAFARGQAVSHAGAYDAARALATEARHLFAGLGEGGEHAETTLVLGTIAMYPGDLHGAVGLFEQSLAERRARGDEHTAARHLGGLGTALLNLGGLGTALLNLGDRPRGRAVLDESLDVAREYEDQWCDAMSLMLLGHQRLADGEPARAQAELVEAVALLQVTGNMVYLTWCREGLAGVAAAGGTSTGRPRSPAAGRHWRPRPAWGRRRRSSRRR